MLGTGKRAWGGGTARRGEGITGSQLPLFGVQDKHSDNSHSLGSVNP